MRIVIIVMLAVLAIASVTHGAIQEFCATVAYAGLAVAAVLLYVERARSTGTRE